MRPTLIQPLPNWHNVYVGELCLLPQALIAAFLGAYRSSPMAFRVASSTSCRSEAVSLMMVSQCSRT